MKKELLIIAMLLIISYLIFSFVINDFNPTNWNWECRLGLILSIGLTFPIYKLIELEKKP